MDTPASIICRERDRRRWTLEMLAYRSGIAAEQIGRYERGVKVPTWRSLERILRALDLRLCLDVERLDPDVESEIARLRDTPEHLWLDDIDADAATLHCLLEGQAWCAVGRLAARLLGLPVPISGLDVLCWPISWVSVGQRAVGLGLRHWSPTDGQWHAVRTAGQLALLAEVHDGVVRLTAGDRPLTLSSAEPGPPCSNVYAGGRSWTVVPLDRIDATDPLVRRLIHEAREAP